MTYRYDPSQDIQTGAQTAQGWGQQRIIWQHFRQKLCEKKEIGRRRLRESLTRPLDPPKL